MKLQPKISVIIPCYNAYKWIDFAVNSAMNQLYPPHEIIIVNDGSRDGTTKKLEKINQRDDRIKVFHNDKNRGIGYTLNQGIKNMTGDVFCWLSADDEWLPNKLREQVKAYNENQDWVLYTDWNFINEKGEVKGTQKCFRGNQEEFRMLSLRTCTINFSSIFIPKHILDDVGLFTEDLRFGEDYQWLLRAILKNVEFKLIGETLVNYRNHKDMLTNEVINQTGDMNERIRKSLGI